MIYRLLIEKDLFSKLYPLSVFLRNETTREVERTPITLATKHIDSGNITFLELRQKST
jgi:hypothetical protein